jgi:hypothetical protein
MTVDEAIQVIRDKDAPWVRKVDASGWLMDSPETPLSYLVECLTVRGLPQENAAIALHKRTKRPPVGTGPESIIRDAEDWKAYLAERNLL